MTGIGIIIISLQIPVFLGLDSQASASSAILSLQNISHYKIDSLTIGLIGLLIVIFFPKKTF